MCLCVCLTRTRDQVAARPSMIKRRLSVKEAAATPDAVRYCFFFSLFKNKYRMERGRSVLMCQSPCASPIRGCGFFGNCVPHISGACSQELSSPRMRMLTEMPCREESGFSSPVGVDRNMPF